jgi:hypothetical protein
MSRINITRLFRTTYSFTNITKIPHQSDCKAVIENNTVFCIQCNVLSAPPLRHLYDGIHPIKKYENEKCIRKWIKLYNKNMC